MEHILKETPEETIKRFELANRSIWLVRRGSLAAGKMSYGIGQSKKEAESLISEHFRCNQGIPPFLYAVGATDKIANRIRVNSVPGAINYIWSLLPLSWHAKYLFRIVVDQDTNSVYLEIGSLNPEDAPLRYWSDDPAGIHHQILECIYTFYMQVDAAETYSLPLFEKQHKKLGEWQKNWYSKLQPKGL